MFFEVPWSAKHLSESGMINHLNYVNVRSSMKIKFPYFPPECDEKINSISELVVSATFISLNYYNYCISLIYTRTRTMLGTHVAQLHTRNLYN